MTRACAIALHLVNWKGVFFERYLLDRHVTALEGANGAGKTTVMIAAYVVLLPDLQRLKFVNLGETGATGGDRGIWGRLGEQGPSYAALEIELGAGERVVCGVYLERKAAPSLALTPFLISNLPAGLSPERVLLSHSGAHEEVPQLDDLASNVKTHGASIEVFGSAKDYFARLFDLGIGPLRLSTDEERNKFNDMLRTSMTGGISRTLTSDLRSFLFKQETGLFDTLSRMRQNLDACRRTRLEVSESRTLELELNGIYTTGHAMFQAALGATRAQRSERQRTLENAERSLAQASERCLELETRADEVQLQKDSLESRLARARAAENAAREQLSRIQRVRAATGRLDTAHAARQSAEGPATLALERKAEASALRASSKADREAAQATLLRAAAGLANLQAGLEELHRQSHAFGRVREQLARARAALSEFVEHAGNTEPALAALLESDAVPPRASVQRALASVHELRGALDRERAERDRFVAGAERLHADYAAARAALALLSGAPSWDAPGACARAELGRLNELDVLATRAGELEREWQRLRGLAQRQLALRTELRALGLDPLSSARDFAIGFHALEQRCREAEAAQREHELGAERQTERASTSEARLGGLEARRERYQRLAEVAARLSSHGATLPRSPSELGAQLRALDEKRRQLLDAGTRCELERQQALALALEYEASTAGPERELTALAERLDGQLLSTRYEDLDVDAARRTQAELGPLNAAIAVDDPYRALSVLCSEPPADENVWLVRSGAWPAVESPRPMAEPPGYVVVDLGYGLRVTRLPRNVQLGRAARQRRALELRAEADGKEREIEHASAELREADAVRAALEQLWEHWELWASGDPKAELAKAREEIDAARALSTAEQRRARELRLEVARLRAEADAQRPLLGEQHLLDAPDHGAESETARAAFERAAGARAELTRVREARSVLLASLHLLDGAPPAALDLEAWQRAEPLANAQRDRLFAAAEALSALDAEHVAWAWSEAERALLERTRLVPELEAQHERARLEVARTEQQFARAEAEWETATAEAQRLAAELASADSHLTRARAELAAERVEDASSAGLEQTELELTRHTELLERLRAEERGSNAEEALCRERLEAARKQERLRQSELDTERRLSEPADSGWAMLSEAARAAGVFEEAPLGRADLVTTESARLWLEAQAKRALLVDRLHAARGADELERAAAEPWEASGATASGAPALGQRYLALWLDVRGWLAKRLPAKLGDTSEPHLGLERLQADLGQLERRLERQEGNLRGTSGDVARSIDVQVRRAAAQVRRLNASLAGVGFGSIHGIRVQMERVAKMDQVLRALRDGETQELLFQSNLPIEDALDEIFRRHAGGRSGGQRLIDYREYLELCVAIQRRPDSEWERVNPSQVSTGEAIGIGAALMMVILAEWERDDQLLRRQRTLGSLRFLFLDEANRLSQDNLGVLFDLCRTLDLQLLIAAPEVARAEGNTTYRLVRRVNAAGREEVLVTGRRASLPAAAARPPDAPIAPPAPVQATLFAP